MGSGNLLSYPITFSSASHHYAPLALEWLRSATPSASFIRCAPHAALATPRGTIALRRLPRSGRWFAPLAASEISRLLTAIASPAHSWRGVEPLLMPPTLGAFRLREPTPSCHKLWHPLSPAGARRAFPARLRSSRRAD
jgi:hypothetical protein